MALTKTEFELPETPVLVEHPVDAWPSFADGAGQRSSVGPDDHRFELIDENTVEEVGSFIDVRSVEIVVVNLGPLSRSGPAVTFTVDDWSFVVARHPDDATAQLKSLGGLGPTHLIRIERTDGGVIEREPYDELTETLWLFLAFVGSHLPGLALPVAFDRHGNAVWTNWQCFTTDPWAPPLGWFDEWVLSDELPALFEAWWRRWQDPFWQQVLRRATRMMVSANRSDPVDIAVTTAWSLLEILAWAVLVVELRWLTREDFEKMSASAVLRLLLGWCGIDPSVPAPLVALNGIRSGRSSLIDAAGAIGWVRNRITHPPQKSDAEWPGFEELIDAWRLEMQWSELIVLRLLGYNGQFGTRCFVEDRRPGEVETVPWA